MLWGLIEPLQIQLAERHFGHSSEKIDRQIGRLEKRHSEWEEQPIQALVLPGPLEVYTGCHVALITGPPMEIS